ncbi:MAG: response regulator [Nostocaceae cyanobacterium]|nr:response regulator [Nostocaceae cyanobacterium]
MNTLPVGRYRFYQKIQTISLLKQISVKSATGCLKIFSSSYYWSMYFKDGRLIYASYSHKMFDILYKKLHDLNQSISTLDNKIYRHLQVIFENSIEHQAIPNPEYLAICWLIKHKYIHREQAGILIEELAIDILKSLLKLEGGSYEFSPESFLDDMPKFCYLDLRVLVKKCQKRCQSQLNIQSPFAQIQRSNFVSRKQQDLPRTRRTKLQISENELATAYLQQGLSSQTEINHNKSWEIAKELTEQKLYKIVCVDDNPLVLNIINDCLDERIFSVHCIQDSLQALMEIINLKPDIIFLDIEMPNVDGYEICYLLRKHSDFKTVPIIFVTEKTEFIDRVKSKLFRASGCLTKPFTQWQLMKNIFKYLD